MGAIKSIALIGIGGYGAMYRSAFSDPALKKYPLTAIVDPNPPGAKILASLLEAKTLVFSSLDQLFKITGIDLAIVAAPIQFHSLHTIALLRAGSHVLCEKPLCSTLEEAADLLRERDKSGKQVTIGYQWSFSNAIQSLKADYLQGVFGKARRLRTIVLWPRNEMYYKRNDWAGAVLDGQGRTVYDSPVHNACAHFLHNMLYVLGESPDRSAAPARVIAETYRGYEIDNYDTAVIRCHTATGAEILFVASHAAGGGKGPTFCYEFENAMVHYDPDSDGTITAKFSDGKRKSYGSPEESHYRKLFSAIEAAEMGTLPLCGIEAALPQVQVMVATQRSRQQVVKFPDSLVTWHGEPTARSINVKGLDPVLQRCFETGLLPSELGIAWAIPGREIEIDPMDRLPTTTAEPSTPRIQPVKLAVTTHLKKRPGVKTSEEMGSH